MKEKLYYDIRVSKMPFKLCEVLLYLGHLYCWLITVNRERERMADACTYTTTTGLCWQITDKIPGYPQDVAGLDVSPLIRQASCLFTSGIIKNDSKF